MVLLGSCGVGGRRERREARAERVALCRGGKSVVFAPPGTFMGKLLSGSILSFLY